MFSANEHGVELNALAEAVTDALAPVGITARTTTARDPSSELPRLVLDAGTAGRHDYAVVTKPGRLDRARATSWALPADRPLLVVAEHVPDAVGDVLRSRGVDYADVAGNVHVEWDGVLVHVGGRRPSAAQHTVPPDTTAARAFTRAGTRVVFGLLSWPELAARPVRDIATTTGVAVGTVHTVLRDLTAAGHLRGSGGHRTLHRGRELLDRWAEAYTVTLARKLAIASFTVPDQTGLPSLVDDFLAAGAQLGGERAAERIDAHLRPVDATFYVDRLPNAVVTTHRLRPDPAGPVHVRQRFWQHDDRDPVVPAPLVYADLLASGEPRQREHAERIRARDPRLVELDRT